MCNKTILKVLSLVLFLNLFVQNTAHSLPFEQLFKGIGKLFQKSADEVPGVFKQSDEVLGANKANRAADENAFNSINEQINDFNLSRISEIKNTKTSSLLETHGVKNADKIIDLTDATQGYFENEDAINTFRLIFWTGRIFRVSNSFNKPVEDRLIINCKTKTENFYFIAILNKKKKWFLLNGNIIDVKELGYYKPQLKKQNLNVLYDEDEFFIFSTKTQKNKKYPSNYFIIDKNGFFINEKNIHGADSPEYIVVNAKNKISKTKDKCIKL